MLSEIMGQESPMCRLADKYIIANAQTDKHELANWMSSLFCINDY